MRPLALLGRVETRAWSGVGCVVEYPLNDRGLAELKRRISGVLRVDAMRAGLEERSVELGNPARERHDRELFVIYKKQDGITIGNRALRGGYGGGEDDVVALGGR